MKNTWFVIYGSVLLVFKNRGIQDCGGGGGGGGCLYRRHETTVCAE